MAFPQVRLSYPGIRQFKSATVTLSTGTVPGAISLVIAPQQDRIEPVGDFVIDYGDGQIIWRDCLVDQGSFQFGDGGYVTSLVLLDFRWKWRTGAISGAYNVRGSDGKILKREGAEAGADAIENSERTPRELAELLFEAMGVQDFNVEQMNDTPRPTCEWVATNPASALADICEQTGSLICPRPDGSVSIVDYGTGADMPSGYVKQVSGSINPPERPAAIEIICGETRYQADLRLELVGLDSDGKVKLPEDLSYIDELEKELDLDTFTDIKDTKKRQLALRSLWRWFRVKTPVEIPGYGEVRFAEQLILESDQVDTVVADAEKQNRKAIAYGKFDDGESGDSESLASSLGISEDDGIPDDLKTDLDKIAQMTVAVGFSIVEYDGVSIVQFSEQIRRLRDGKLSAPELYLRCAVRVRDPKTRAVDRYSRKRELDNGVQGLQPLSIVKNELTLGYVDGQPVDRDLVDQAADEFIDAALKEYVTEQPLDGVYGWIVPVELDGQIQSVTYAIERGARTTISRGHDHGSPICEPGNVRRKIERDRATIAAAYKDGDKYARDQIRSFVPKIVGGA